MQLLDQLSQVRAEQARLTAALEAAQQQEIALLQEYAEQTRRFAEGQALTWRGRKAVVRGVTAYYAAEDKRSIALSYGVFSPGGEPLDSLREDNLALAVAA